MAERRMFSKSIIGSARFLLMPATSRLLYYDLGMQADDDGVVEAFSVMRTTGAAEDDLRVLASKGFVHILNDELVTYITDWNRNNYIQKDRYHPSIYKKLLVQIANESGMDTECIQTVSKMDTQVRLGKDRLGKDSLGESTGEPPAAATPAELPKPARKAYGQYGWVKLTESDYNCLLNDLGQTEVERCIAYVDESAQLTRNKNKWRDWALTIRRCSREGWGLRKREPAPRADSADDPREDIERMGKYLERLQQGKEES